MFPYEVRDKQQEIRYFTRYIVVGISGIFVNTGILYGLTESRLLPYYNSAIIALVASFASNYILNDQWTFQGVNEGHHADKFSRFFLIAIVGYLISYVLLLFGTEVLHFWYILSNLGGIGVAFIWNYTMNRSVVWK